MSIPGTTITTTSEPTKMEFEMTGSQSNQSSRDAGDSKRESKPSVPPNGVVTPPGVLRASRENFDFVEISVPRDGDCGFLAMGITRSQGLEQLLGPALQDNPKLYEKIRKTVEPEISWVASTIPGDYEFKLMTPEIESGLQPLEKQTVYCKIDLEKEKVQIRMLEMKGCHEINKTDLKLKPEAPFPQNLATLPKAQIQHVISELGCLQKRLICWLENVPNKGQEELRVIDELKNLINEREKIYALSAQLLAKGKENLPKNVADTIQVNIQLLIGHLKKLNPSDDLNNFIQELEKFVIREKTLTTDLARVCAHPFVYAVYIYNQYRVRKAWLETVPARTGTIDALALLNNKLVLIYEVDREAKVPNALKLKHQTPFNGYQLDEIRVFLHSPAGTHFDNLWLHNEHDLPRLYKQFDIIDKQSFFNNIFALRNFIFSGEQVSPEVARERQKALANMNLLIALEHRGVAAMDTSPNDIATSSSSSASCNAKFIFHSHRLNPYLFQTTKERTDIQREKYPEILQSLIAASTSPLATHFLKRAQIWQSLGWIPESIIDASNAIAAVNKLPEDPQLRVPADLKLRFEAGRIRIMGYLELKKNKHIIFDEDELVRFNAHALADADELVRLAPNSLDSYTIRAGLFLAIEQWNKVIADCALALEINPTVLQLYYYQAICYSNLNKYQEAYEAVVKATKNDSWKQLAPGAWNHCIELGKEAQKRLAGPNNTAPTRMEVDQVGQETAANNNPPTEGADSKDASQDTKPKSDSAESKDASSGDNKPADGKGASESHKRKPDSAGDAEHPNKKGRTDNSNNGFSTAVSEGVDFQAALNVFLEKDQKKLERSDFEKSKALFSAGLKKNFSELGNEALETIKVYLSILYGQSPDDFYKVLPLLAKKQLPEKEQEALLMHLCFDDAIQFFFKQFGIKDLKRPNDAITYFQKIFEIYHEFSCILQIMEAAREKIFKIHTDPVVHSVVYFVEALFAAKLHQKYPENGEYQKQSQLAYQKIFEQHIAKDLQEKIKLAYETLINKPDYNFTATQAVCMDIKTYAFDNLPELLREISKTVGCKPEIFCNKFKNEIQFIAEPKALAIFYFFGALNIKIYDSKQAEVWYQAMSNEKVEPDLKTELEAEYQRLSELQRKSEDDFTDKILEASLKILSKKDKGSIDIPMTDVNDAGPGDSKQEGKYGKSEQRGSAKFTSKFVPKGASSSSQSSRSRFPWPGNRLGTNAFPADFWEPVKPSSAPQDLGGSPSSRLTFRS